MKKTKFIALTISAVLLLVFAFCFSATADGETGGKPEIISKNISYEGNFALLLAVDSSTVEGGGVKIEVFDEDKTTKLGEYSSSETENIKISGVTKNVYVIKTKGIAPVDMAKQYYFRATDAAGNAGDLERYSIAEYMYERTYLCNSTKSQLELYENTLSVGALAQTVLINDVRPGTENDVTLVTDYLFVTLEGGVLSDGYSQGIYLPGTVLTATPNAEIPSWNIVDLEDESAKDVRVEDDITVNSHLKIEAGTYVFPNHVFTIEDRVDSKLVPGETHVWYYTCSECGAVSRNLTFNDHVYDKEVVEDRFFAALKSGDTPAQYYKTCECGAVGEDTFGVQIPDTVPRGSGAYYTGGAYNISDFGTFKNYNYDSGSVTSYANTAGNDTTRKNELKDGALYSTPKTSGGYWNIIGAAATSDTHVFETDIMFTRGTWDGSAATFGWMGFSNSTGDGANSRQATKFTLDPVLGDTAENSAAKYIEAVKMYSAAGDIYTFDTDKWYNIRIVATFVDMGDDGTSATTENYYTVDIFVNGVQVTDDYKAPHGNHANLKINGEIAKFGMEWRGAASMGATLNNFSVAFDNTFFGSKDIEE